MHTLLNYYLPVLTWGGVIFALSLSTFGGNWTLNLLRAILGAAGIVLSHHALLQLNAVVRELAHLAEYFVLALLLWRAGRKEAWRHWDASAVLVTLGTVAAVASADETFQLFRRLRTGSMTDVLIDTSGGLLAVALLWWWTRKEPAPNVSNVS